MIIPTYNRAERVVHAVQSVLNQTYSNIELVVVDDGSTDNTCERLSVYSDRIRYISTPPSGKPGGPARNVGIVAGRGEYLAFLDSDDEWLPDKIAKQVAVLDNPDIHVVYCDAFYVDDDGNILRLQRERYRGNILPRLLLGNVVSGSASAVMLRRSCFAKVAPFRPDLDVGDDWDLWLRLAAHFNFDFVPEPLVRIRMHRKNDHKSKSRMTLSRSCRAIYEGLKADPEARPYILSHWRECQATMAYWNASFLCVEGDRSEARSEYIKSIRILPLQSRAYVGFFKTLLGNRTISFLKRVRSHPASIYFGRGREK